MARSAAVSDDGIYARLVSRAAMCRSKSAIRVFRYLTSGQNYSLLLGLKPIKRPLYFGAFILPVGDAIGHPHALHAT